MQQSAVESILPASSMLPASTAGGSDGPGCVLGTGWRATGSFQGPGVASTLAPPLPPESGPSRSQLGGGTFPHASLGVDSAVAQTSAGHCAADASGSRERRGSVTPTSTSSEDSPRGATQAARGKKGVAEDLCRAAGSLSPHPESLLEGLAPQQQTPRQAATSSGSCITPPVIGSPYRPSGPPPSPAVTLQFPGAQAQEGCTLVTDHVAPARQDDSLGVSEELDRDFASAAAFPIINSSPMQSFGSWLQTTGNAYTNIHDESASAAPAVSKGALVSMAGAWRHDRSPDFRSDMETSSAARPSPDAALLHPMPSPSPRTPGQLGRPLSPPLQTAAEGLHWLARSVEEKFGNAAGSSPAATAASSTPPTTLPTAMSGSAISAAAAAEPVAMLPSAASAEESPFGSLTSSLPQA